MPVINVQTLPLDSSINKGEILKKLVSSLSAAIDTPEERIFAQWQTTDVFVDSMEPKSQWCNSSHPPVVKIDMFEGRDETKKDKALDSIVSTIKQELDFAGNPFVFISDIANGHVHTGGKIIKK